MQYTNNELKEHIKTKNNELKKFRKRSEFIILMQKEEELQKLLLDDYKQKYTELDNFKESIKKLLIELRFKEDEIVTLRQEQLNKLDKTILEYKIKETRERERQQPIIDNLNIKVIEEEEKIRNVKETLQPTIDQAITMIALKKEEIGIIKTEACSQIERVKQDLRVSVPEFAEYEKKKK